DVLTGAIVIGIAIARLQHGVGLVHALAFAAAIMLGAVIVYCFWLIITTSAFWIVRMDQLVELFQGVYQTGRWPVGIYPTWLRFGLTFLVPIAFAVTVPAEAVASRLPRPLYTREPSGSMTNQSPSGVIAMGTVVSASVCADTATEAICDHVRPRSMLRIRTTLLASPAPCTVIAMTVPRPCTAAGDPAVHDGAFTGSATEVHLEPSLEA